jgi:hypothetical protein
MTGRGRRTHRAAPLLAREQTGAGADEVEPWVAANAMIGVHRALLGYARSQILAGTRNPLLGRRVRAQTKRALARLEAGLGGYASR